jgi:hypothetical protein
MKIDLPNAQARLRPYTLTGVPIETKRFNRNFSRVVLSAAHVVADACSSSEPSAPAAIDWEQTMAFRRYLADLGLGIAEAMDTAQRGSGLDWPNARELIRRTRAELPNALVFNGVGTDQLKPADARSLDDVRAAYLEQIETVQKIGARIVLMASRALARVAERPDDYISVYRDALSACEEPVIIHWLGDMFDPALAGYWGNSDFEPALETCLAVIAESRNKVDGVKLSLLDKDKEISMRRRLPSGVKMYTGDDFNYPELIAGDGQHFSHALLGIFDPIASAAALAMSKLAAGDCDEYRAVLDPTVPLARLIFRAPTEHYKTGVVFLSWLNGFQTHFIMPNGAQAMRPLPYFVETFKLADACGLLRDPDLAVSRMKALLALYGI